MQQPRGQQTSADKNFAERVRCLSIAAACTSACIRLVTASDGPVSRFGWGAAYHCAVSRLQSDTGSIVAPELPLY